MAETGWQAARAYVWVGPGPTPHACPCATRMSFNRVAFQGAPGREGRSPLPPRAVKICGRSFLFTFLRHLRNHLIKLPSIFY